MNESEHRYTYYLMRVILSCEIIGYYFVCQSDLMHIIEQHLSGGDLRYTFQIEPYQITQSELQSLDKLVERVTS